jgi:multidrug efflux pump subunit AcrA (membrane-fusion protein)
MKNFLSSVVNKFKAKSKWQKLLIILGLVIAVILLKNTFFQKEEVASYQFSTVKKGNIIDQVSETGSITTSNKAEVGTTINGVVSEVYVDNGDSVKRGQTLFYVISNATQAERTKAYSSYLSAKNSMEAAKAKINSLESSMWQAHEDFESRSLDTELSVDDPIFIQTERDWKAAESNYLNQKDVISQSEISLSSSWLDYQATLDGPVKATVDGEIANLAIAEGQMIKSVDTALIIKTEGDVWVELAINENDIQDIAPGQKAEVTIDALSGLAVPATVQRVDEFATVVSDVALYYVYLTLDEVDNQIRPGMTTQVEITTQEKNDVLLVSISAIKPYQGEKAVQILDENTGTVVYQPVEIGVMSDISVEVISGLEEGQKIITGESSSKSSSSSSSGGLFSGPR